MQNSSLKDQITVIMITVLVFIFLIWYFGIRNFNSEYETLVVTRDTLRTREAECDKLKQQNDDTSHKITDMEKQIQEVEQSFLPELNNENIEQYLLKLFEDNNCPFLSKISVSPVECDSIVLPDGSISTDGLLCNRVTLEYAATDGYCVPQYNYTEAYSTYDNIYADEILKSLALMGTYDYNYGYDGFVETLKQIEKINPSCVKINKIEVKSTLGFNKLIAEVDFYAINTVHRVSAASSSEAYVVWSGATDTPVGNGYIGVPLLVTNINNAFYGCQIVDGDLTMIADRPFATYYSIGVFTYLASGEGLFIQDPEADAEALATENKSVPLVPTTSLLYAEEAEAITDTVPET